MSLWRYVDLIHSQGAQFRRTFRKLNWYFDLLWLASFWFLVSLTWEPIKGLCSVHFCVDMSGWLSLPAIALLNIAQLKTLALLIPSCHGWLISYNWRYFHHRDCSTTVCYHCCWHTDDRRLIAISDSQLFGFLTKPCSERSVHLRLSHGSHAAENALRCDPQPSTSICLQRLLPLWASKQTCEPKNSAESSRAFYGVK